MTIFVSRERSASESSSYAASLTHNFDSPKMPASGSAAGSFGLDPSPPAEPGGVGFGSPGPGGRPLGGEGDCTGSNFFFHAAMLAATTFGSPPRLRMNSTGSAQFCW